MKERAKLMIDPSKLELWSLALFESRRIELFLCS